MIDFRIKMSYGPNATPVDNIQYAVSKIIYEQFDTEELMKKFSENTRLYLQENIRTETDPYGVKIASYAPLSPEWILKKGHSIMFLWQGYMYFSVKMANVGDGYVIFIGDTRRKKVALWLNETILGNGRRREFWGIIPPKADEILKDTIMNYNQNRIY